MTPAPMTAEQIVEALCLEAEWCGTYFGIVPEKYEAARANRDRIKSASINMLEQIDGEREKDCDCRYCVAWRKLEEACRGK